MRVQQSRSCYLPVSCMDRVYLRSRHPFLTSKGRNSRHFACNLGSVCQAGFGGSNNKPSTQKSNNASSSNTGADVKIKLPNSREEAISQAASAITLKLGKPTKSSKPPGRPKLALGLDLEQKLAVEVPVADASPSAAVELAQDIISALPAELGKQFTIVSCGGGSFNSSKASVVSLEECIKERRALTGSIIIASPSTNQLTGLAKLMGDWKGSASILLNAQWAAELAEEDSAGSMDAQQVAFAKSFETVYCFFPISIKAFVVSTTDGVVFRQFGSDPGTSAPWRIFIQKGQAFEPVARMNQRPTSIEIEVSFYNANAANSPLTQGAKFLKGLMSDKKKGV